jgi:hypothetical protein
MAHTDTMRSAAAIESLDAMTKGAQTEQGTAPQTPEPEAPKKSLGQKAEAVGQDLGMGVIESPRALVKGVRDAYQSMIDLAGHAVDFAGQALPQPSASTTAESAARASAAGLTPDKMAEGFTLPDINAPKSVTGTIEKNVIQFVTSLNAAGGQLKALGLPTEIAGWSGRAATALKGFVGMFEGFDGSQQNLSNLVQSVPSLQNPVSKFLATSPEDGDAVNRLKSAVEGTMGGQLVDAFVGGLRFLRNANAARSSAEAALSTLEGEDLGEPLTSTPTKGMAALGNQLADDSMPLVQADFNSGRQQVAAQERATQHLTPEDIFPSGEKAGEAGEAAEPTNVLQGKFGPQFAGMDENYVYLSDGTKKEIPEELKQVPWTDADQLGTKGEVAANEEGAQPQPTKGDLDKWVKSVTDYGESQKPQVNQAKPGVYINFSKIDAPDDIKTAMGQMADAMKDNINQARRGVQKFEDTILGADATDAWGALMSRRVGDPLNAEQSLAARQLWATSMAKVQELAGIVKADPSVENMFAFRKMLATHAAIQENVIAARTETARALSSWRIPAGTQGQDYRLAQMMQQLDAGAGSKGGLATTLDMANRVSALQEAMDVQGMDNFGQKSLYAKTRDAVLEAWTNGLLTALVTHTKVIASNAATTALRLGERGIASKISSVLGDTNGVQVGETSSQLAGLVSGLADAFRYAGRAANAALTRQSLPALGGDPLSNAVKAAKTGTYSAGSDVVDHNFSGAISSQAFGLANSGWLGQGVDLLGSLIRAPGRALTAEHDFFRSIAYRMELNALATRQATQEVNAGRITQDALGSRIQEIVANPPPSVTMGADAGMTYQTFTDAPGKLAQNIENLRNDFPLLRVVLPFYKIPSRILSFTFERSPLAPLMSAYKSNIAAGGAREALARAQMGLGTGMMLATADAVLSGKATGSGPPHASQRGAMQEQGWLPYSMKVGDRWVQYNHLETIGSSMAMAADVVETMHNYGQAVNGDNPDMEKLAIATTLSIGQDITSKTYLQGLSNFFEMMANPKTEGESQVRQMAASVVPAGVAAADRIQDPYQRSVYSIADAIKARTPGASETLPPRRDKWGQPVEHASGMGTAYDLLSPFATRQPTDSPIDSEINRLGANVNLPEGRTSFNGATVDLHKDPQVYSRYVQLAGNDYKDPAWGQGAHDMLNDLVTGKSPLSPIYNMKSDGPDGGKAEMIRTIMNQYKDGAKRQLVSEFPKLQQEIEQKQSDRQALKMPQIQ